MVIGGCYIRGSASLQRKYGKCNFLCPFTELFVRRPVTRRSKQRCTQVTHCVFVLLCRLICEYREIHGTTMSFGESKNDPMKAAMCDRRHFPERAANRETIESKHRTNMLPAQLSFTVLKPDPSLVP